MTEAHVPNEIDGPHEGPIKTPKQLILAVLYAFVVPIAAIVLLVTYVTSDKRPAAGSEALGAKAVAARIRPVGMVAVKDASDLSSLKSGEQVFAGQCSACHAAGALGAPKLGDAEAWAPRIKSGYETLLHSALAGKGQMPPQAGGDFSDFEIARAVVYQANQAGAKFAEPVAPAASGASVTAGLATSAATVLAGASAPRGDANAGTPSATPSAALNAQVRDAVANAVPGKSAPLNVAAAATGTATGAKGGDSAAAPALYGQICGACHAAGVAGAPKLGDKAAWAPRVAQGIDALTASVIKGKGAMPPKGGSNASDGEIKTVVTYMVGTAK